MPAAVKTIILAAGHGGTDTGAVSPDGKHRERDQAITIVDLIAPRLRESGHNVIIAPPAPHTPPTIPSINASHPAGSAVAIEIHRDSADTIRGLPDADTRLGIYHSGSTISTAYADAWAASARANGAHRTTWARNHKASRFAGGLGWINQIHTRSFLIELAFMQGRNDDVHLTWLASTAAIAIADRIRRVPTV